MGRHLAEFLLEAAHVDGAARAQLAHLEPHAATAAAAAAARRAVRVGGRRPIAAAATARAVAIAAAPRVGVGVDEAPDEDLRALARRRAAREADRRPAGPRT